MKNFEIWVNGHLDGFTSGKSSRSVEMRLRRFGWKTSMIDIVEIN